MLGVLSEGVERVQSDLRSLLTTVIAAVILYAFGLVDEVVRRVVAATLSEHLETRVRVSALSVWAVNGRVEFDGTAVENWRGRGFTTNGNGTYDRGGGGGVEPPRDTKRARTLTMGRNHRRSSPTRGEEEEEETAPKGQFGGAQIGAGSSNQGGRHKRTPKRNPYRDAVEIHEATVHMDVARALTRRVVAIQSMRVRRLRVVLVRRADGTLNVEMFSRRKRAAERPTREEDGTREEQASSSASRDAASPSAAKTTKPCAADDDADGWVDLGDDEDDGVTAAPRTTEPPTPGSAARLKLWSLVASARAEAEARVRELRSTDDGERSVLEDAALYALDAAEKAKAEARIASDKAKRWARDRLKESVGEAVDALFATLANGAASGSGLAATTTGGQKHGGAAGTRAGPGDDPFIFTPEERDDPAGGSFLTQPTTWKLVFEADATVRVSEFRVDVVDAESGRPLVDPPLVFGERVLKDLALDDLDDDDDDRTRTASTTTNKHKSKQTVTNQPGKVLLKLGSVLAKSCVEELVENRPADAARLAKAVAKQIATDTRRRAADEVAKVAKKWGVEEWGDAAKAVLLGNNNTTTGGAHVASSSSSSGGSGGATGYFGGGPGDRPEADAVASKPPLSDATSSSGSLAALSAAGLRDRGVSF